MQFANTFTRAAVLVASLAMVSLVLTSCPLTPTSGNLRLLLATGASGGDIAPGAAGLTPVAPEEIFSLYLTIERATLLAESGSGATNTDVLSAPLTVELIETSGLSLLASEIMAEEGGYTGVEVVLGPVELALSSDPLNPVAVDLPEPATIQINFPFEILPDSGGILLVDFGGLSLYHGESGGFVFAPDPAASLREEAHNVRIKGRIAELNRDALSFDLAADGGTYAVDFEGSSIYRPGDLTTPAGSPGDLQNQFRIAVLTSLDLGASIAPVRIEVLDLPATSRDEEGDRITICHLHPGDLGSAYTVKVARSLLQDHLDHGDFTGPCEEGEPFTLTYQAGTGGAIEGEATQSVLPGASGTPVTAIAEEGFAFLEWSDGRTDNPRTDTAVGADLAVTATFIEQFTLAYTAGEGGTLSGPTTQQVKRGESGDRVTAVRDSGYQFTRWSDGRTDNPRVDENVTGDISVTAEFTRIFSLEYLAGEGGSLTGETSQRVLIGADATPVTAVPDTDFGFTGWSDGSLENPRTDLDVNADLNVTANFAELFDLAYAAGPNGHVEGETAQVVPGGLDGMPVTAVADAEFGFVRWSDGRTDNPRTDTAITGDVSVTAEFAAAITITYTAGEHGTISGAAEQIVGMGGTGSPVTAVSDSGYEFVEWSDGRTDNPRIDENVLLPTSVTALFDRAFSLIYLSGPNGSIQGPAEQRIIIGRDGMAVTAVPESGYEFDSWSDSRTDNPRTDLVVMEDLTVTANFVRAFTLQYTAGTNGSLLGETTQIVRFGGTGSPVTAHANSGFGFLQWSDGVLDNPRIDGDVMADLSVTAEFLAGISLSYSAEANGTLEGEVHQILTNSDSGTPVTAVPSEGHLFLEWSDGRTDNPRVDTDVTAELIVSARFFSVPEMILVRGGSFTMGRTDEGDDSSFDSDAELPRHQVSLSEYEIGMYEVRNDEYAIFMNFMNHPLRDLLRRGSGDSWEGHNEGVFFDGGGGELTRIYQYQFGEVSLDFNRETKVMEPLRKQGLPEGTSYNLADHPVTEPTWYGAVLYCNWLSERAGLEAVYDTVTWEGDLSKTGYRLPTEAEWERAAAWDGERHWIYSFTADTLEGGSRANYYNGPQFVPPPDFDNREFVNPLGLIQDAQTAYTSPVGWFNGINVSPNGNVQTQDSRSPIGAYDMSGNLFEWCHDWYSGTYYGESPEVNPTGPLSGTRRVLRGGGWARQVGSVRNRSAYRYHFNPLDGDGIVGFRLARSTGQVSRFTLTYIAGENGALDGDTLQLVELGGSGSEVTAVPADGFGFSHWSDGVVENPRTDAGVSNDITVTAEFAPAIRLTYQPGANGHIEGSTEQIIGLGGTGTPVTAIGNSGFGFLSWSDGSTANPRIDAEVEEDLSVTANFAPGYMLTYVAGEHGHIEGFSPQFVIDGRDGLPVTAVPDIGFGFDSWSDGSTENPRTDLAVTAQLTVTATFVPRYTLVYNAGANGNLVGQNTQEVNEGDDGTEVTAVAVSGFSFVGWSDGVTDNPRIDRNVMANINATANFASVLTLNYTAGANGTIEGELLQLLGPGESGTAVVAIPQEGHYFVQWSDGRTDNPRVDENVQENVIVTASFTAAIDMVAVPEGFFVMGRTASGDDVLYGAADELPQHAVALSAYEIGRFEITNAQYAEFLNFLLHPSRRLLARHDGSIWQGENDDIYYNNTDAPQKIFAYRLGEVNLTYNATTKLLQPVTKPGLPAGTSYSMANNPVTESTWYGAVLYTNWLSERAGLEPVYDTDTWAADFTKNGYRLPTEAEWERAAAWDGEKHWIYSFTSDTLSGRANVNFHDGPYDPPPDLDNTMFVNPLGLVQDAITPYTSPVGWFNGVNISPNGDIQTEDSKSPVGCYDMSGNLVEWCHDWYSATYYDESPDTDPTGPEAGTQRVARGGAWGRLVSIGRQRTAFRARYGPSFTDGIVGFRIAR